MRENTDQKKTPNVDTFHAVVLTLIWVGFLGVRFLKLVKIMLLTWNLVCKYTNIYSFRKYTV